MLPWRNNKEDKRADSQCVMLARFSAIGNVAMTIPAVYSACRNYPSIRFVMVTRPSMTSMFVNAPKNLTVVGADIHGEYRGAAGMWRLLRRMVREYGVDGLIDLQDSSLTKWLRVAAIAAGLRVVHIDRDLGNKRALTRRNNKVMLPLISSGSRYRNAFTAFGLPFTDDFGGLFEGKKAPAEAFKTIPTPDYIAGTHWIGVAPFALHRGKIYPSDMMEEVVRNLLAQGDVEIFLFGAAGEEAEVTDGWARKYQHVTSLAGKHFGFAAELALVSNLDCMVSMDSANMHLASLVSVPVVSVWGATHPYCGFKAWRQDDDSVIQLPLTCRPCSVFGDKPCYRGDYLCLTGIKPSVISDKVISIIQNQSK